MKPSTQQLRLMSWNLLAPCYNRYKGIPGQSGMSSSVRESSNVARYTERFQQIVELLEEHREVDVFLLQEYFFEEEEEDGEGEQRRQPRESLIRTAMQDRYAIYEAQRPGKRDGLAMFVRKDSTWTVDRVEALDFRDAGRRLALLCRLTTSDVEAADQSRSDHDNDHDDERKRETDDEENRVGVVVANVHLTFPHHEFDDRLRAVQVKKSIDKGNAMRRPGDAFVLMGDINKAEQRQQQQQQRVDVVEHVCSQHGLNAALRGHYVSHLTHRGTETAADQAFFTGDALSLDKAVIEPENMPSRSWSDAYLPMSDHRPIRVIFNVKK